MDWRQYQIRILPFQIPIDFWLVKKMPDNLLKCSNLRCLQNWSYEKLKKQTKFPKSSSGCDLIKHKMLNVFNVSPNYFLQFFHAIWLIISVVLLRILGKGNSYHHIKADD